MAFSIHNYLNIRAAYAPTIRSDGKKVAFLTNVTGIPQAWQTDLPDPGDPLPWPDQVSFAGDRVIDLQYSPAPGDNRLIYSYDEGGNENAQLFLWEEQAGITPLTPGYDQAMHIFFEWSADGSRILFAANRRDPGLFDMYQLVLGESDPVLVWENEQPGFVIWHALSPDNRSAAFCLMRSSYDCELFLLDLDDGQARSLNPGAEPIFVSHPCFSQDGASLYAVLDQDSDFRYIARCDLATSAWTRAAVFDWDVNDLAISPDRHRLGFGVNQDGYIIPHVLELESGRVTAVTGLDETAGVAVYFDNAPVFTPDSGRLIYSFTSPTRTSDIFCWDFSDSGTVWPLTRSAHGGLPVSSFSNYSLIHYPTFDDLEIPAWFCEPGPEFPRPLPAVVIVHGGPESQSAAIFNFLAQYLLQQGFALLIPNVRGSSGYGKTYAHLDDVEKRMDSVADLAHGVKWLRSQGQIDVDRVAVYGGSYGGFMVLAAMTHYPDLWAAGVNIVGISNFITFLENTSSYRRAHREAEYGSLEHDRAFLEEISPIHHVQKLTAPLMVIHGANDPRVPLGEAEQLVEALRAKGNEVEYMVFEDEGHGLQKLKNKLVAYPAVAAFLKRHLLPR